MKCKICQLYIESCKTGEVFERLLRQPCIGFETEVLTWPDLHPSHTMLNKGCVWQCSGCGRQARPSSLTLGSNPHSKKLVAPCPARNRLNFRRASLPGEPLQPDAHVSKSPGPQGQGEVSRPLLGFPKASPPKAGPKLSHLLCRPILLLGPLCNPRSEDQGKHLVARPEVHAQLTSPGSSRPQGLGVATPLVPKAKVKAKSGTLETLRKASPLGKSWWQEQPRPFH